MVVFLSGLSLGFSLIVAIGAQNAYVIRQGLRREFIFSVALTCAVSDAILISIGVGGLGVAVDRIPVLLSIFTLFGALFLFFLGGMHLKYAVAGNRLLAESSIGRQSFGKTIMTCLALTWLNPHVYLETVFLLGSVSASQSSPWLFGVGAITSSFLFFFSLAYGTRYLSKYLNKDSVWTWIDVSMCVVMWSICISLLRSWMIG